MTKLYLGMSLSTCVKGWHTSSYLYVTAAGNMRGPLMWAPITTNRSNASMRSSVAYW